MKDLIILILSLLLAIGSFTYGYLSYQSHKHSYELQSACISAKISAGIPRKDIILTPTGCKVIAPL